MYFHIDESGNTGNNLFDHHQPRLSYGLLSSLTNADVLCLAQHRKIQNRIGSELIHANELGIGGLANISPYLIDIQKRMKFDFDYYFIEKPTYALVSFFEAVFDAGLNEAVRWESYWTPLRFVLIYKLTSIFDEELLRRAWRLCLAKRIDQHEGEIVSLLTEVKYRTEQSNLDPRSIEVIVDALRFGIANPLSLDFGHPDQLIVSPNAVGFQFVVSAIARRVRKKNKKKAASILVDRQTQFNKAQIQTHHILGKFSEGMKAASHSDRQQYLNHPMFTLLDKADITHKDLPDTALTISNSANSIGLQIVDVYLWLANKIIDGTELPSELVALWMSFSKRSLIDGISLEGMRQRFLQFERVLPKYSDLTPEQLANISESIERHRNKVRSLGL